MSSSHKRFAGVRVLIFDLDGTLIDSKLDLAHSVNAMLAHMGREAHVHETIFSFIGDGADSFLFHQQFPYAPLDAFGHNGSSFFNSRYFFHYRTSGMRIHDFRLAKHDATRVLQFRFGNIPS